MKVQKRHRSVKQDKLYGAIMILTCLPVAIYFLYLIFDDAAGSFSASIIAILFGLFFTFLGGLLIKRSEKKKSDLKYLKKNSSKSEGKVEDIFTRLKGYKLYDPEDTTYMIYKFETSQGEEYQTRIDIEESDNLNIGDKIEVVYDPKKPAINYWVGEIE